jgi:hypothetical protein
MLPGGRRGKQIEVRVECVGRVAEPVGGVLAEAFDPLSDVWRERGHGGRIDLPALRGELARRSSSVQDSRPARIERATLDQVDPERLDRLPVDRVLPGAPECCRRRRA